MELSDFLANIRYVGSSPYAFAAYIAVVVAWVYAAIARHRLGKIAELLKDLPPEDRTQVILKEYSTVPRSGLSSDQWIKSRQHMLYFLAFLSLVVCLTLVVIIALALTTTQNHQNDKSTESSAVLGLLHVQSERILELERRVSDAEAQAAELKAKLKSLAQDDASPSLVALMQKLHQEYDPSDTRVEAVLLDPSLNAEDKVTLTIMSLIKKIDRHISYQVNRVEALRSSPLIDSPSIDVETMKLKRLIDKRSQTFDMLRQLIDKYNKTAKATIDSLGR